MDERKKAVRLWFDMWLRQKDLGIDAVFDERVLYIESWGLEYEGREAVKAWFGNGIQEEGFLYGKSSSIFKKATKRW